MDEEMADKLKIIMEEFDIAKAPVDMVLRMAVEMVKLRGKLERIKEELDA